MSEDLNVFHQISKGEFTHLVPYPSRPSLPAVLRKKAADLSADELSALPALKAAFEAAMAEYPKQQAEYRRADHECEARFRAALANEFGTANNPKEPLLYEKAYDIGHSSGFSEIANAYANLVDLIT